MSRKRTQPDTSDELAELVAMAGGLAHEIRNPLSTLRMNLQLLAEDWQEDAPDGTDLRRRSLNRLGVLRAEAERRAALIQKPGDAVRDVARWCDEFLEWVTSLPAAAPGEDGISRRNATRPARRLRDTVGARIGTIRESTPQQRLRDIIDRDPDVRMFRKAIADGTIQ